MKKAVLTFVCLSSFVATAATMNFTGTFRGSAEYYNKLSLGAAGVSPNKSFMTGRFLLNPNLIVDDHFSVQSQWLLLQSPNMAPACSALGIGQGSYVLGDVQSQALVLCRAWLEWNTDFGSLRVGRMPFSWGYGLMWDAGSGVWDDFQTTLDRVEYRLFLGNVIGAVAYSKGRKLSVLGSDNDQEFYTAYLQYNNEELEVEGGVLYEKQVRSVSQSGDLSRGNTPTQTTRPGNIYALPPGYTGTPTPLSVKMPYPLSTNVVDVYLKKTAGRFSFGGEVNWISGTSTDYGGGGGTDNLNALALTANLAYELHSVRAFMEFLYASGDSNLMNDQNSSFSLLHRNRRPGLILGRELVGIYQGNQVQQGSLVVYGQQDTFSGVFFLRPGLRFEWSPTLASGLELIVAQKATTAAGENGALGVEVDLGTDYTLYKNLELGAAAGYLFAGGGLGVASPKSPFAVRASLTLQF